MATPAEILANISDAVKVVYDSLLRSTTLLVDINSYVGKAASNLIGSRASDGGAAMKALRTSFADLVPGFTGILNPHIFDLQEETGYKQVGVIDADWWEFLRDYMAAGSLSVKTRDLTFVAPAPGTNVGTGTLYILTEDRLGQDVESVDISKYQAECLVDQNLGASLGQETFELTQTAIAEDVLEDGGAGETDSLQALAGDSILQNHSFQTVDPAPLAPLDIAGWDYSGDPTTQLEFEQDVFSRVSPEEDSQGEIYSLKVKATGGAQTLSQSMRALSANLDPLVPMFASIAVQQSVGTGAGSMALSFGNATIAVPDVTALPAGFSDLIIPADKELWFENYNVDPLAYTVDLNISAGYISLDAAVLAPWTAFRGIWYAMLGGDIPFLKGDVFVNQVDLATIEGKIQLVFYVLYGVYLTASGTPSQPDP